MSLRSFRQTQPASHLRQYAFPLIEGFLDGKLERATNFLTGASTSQISVIRWEQETPHSSQQYLGEWDSLQNIPPLGVGVGIDGQYVRVAAGITHHFGSWDANLNSPVLTSSVGTEGGGYTVSVPGATNLNGITAWAVGDALLFTAGAWRKLAPVNSTSSLFFPGELVQNNGGQWKKAAARFQFTGEKLIVTNRHTDRELPKDYWVLVAQVGDSPEYRVIDGSCSIQRP